MGETMNMNPVPTDEDFNAVSLVEEKIDKQVPYSEDIWKNVTFYEPQDPNRDIFWVGHYVYAHAYVDPTTAQARGLASLCRYVPEGGEFSTTLFPKGLQMKTSEDIDSWSSSCIKNLFNISETQEPSTTPSGQMKKVGLTEVIAAYSGTASAKLKDITVTETEVIHTLYAFLYTLPRYAKKSKESPEEVSRLIDRVTRINPRVQPSFLEHLYTVFSGQRRWDLHMSEGGAIITNLALGGLVTLQNDGLDLHLRAQLSFSLLGVIYHAFTSYQLLLQVSNLDKRKSGDVLRCIPTPSSDNLIKTIVKRKDVLSAKPCWYAVASVCYPMVKSEFSLTRQPAISRSLVLIIQWLNKDQTDNLSKLVMKLSAREKAEGDYGFECYKRCVEAEEIKITREVTVNGKKVDFTSVAASELTERKRLGQKKPKVTKTHSDNSGSSDEGEKGMPEPPPAKGLRASYGL